MILLSIGNNISYKRHTIICRRLLRIFGKASHVKKKNTLATFWQRFQNWATFSNIWSHWLLLNCKSNLVPQSKQYNHVITCLYTNISKHLATFWQRLEKLGYFLATFGKIGPLFPTSGYTGLCLSLNLIRCLKVNSQFTIYFPVIKGKKFSSIDHRGSGLPTSLWLRPHSCSAARMITRKNGWESQTSYMKYPVVDVINKFKHRITFIG